MRDSQEKKDLAVNSAQLIAESAALILQLRDSRYQREIDDFFKLKKLIDKNNALTVEERQKFFELFKAKSPIDQIERNLSDLETAFQRLLKLQREQSNEIYKETPLSSAINKALKQLWDTKAELQRKKPLWQSLKDWINPNNAEDTFPSKKDRDEAAHLYAVIMERHHTTDHIKWLTKEETHKTLAKELKEVCLYFYQQIPQEQLLKGKELYELRDFNDALLEHIKKSLLEVQTVEERLKVIQLWLNVRKNCREEHNYFGAEMIRAAMLSKDIYNLIKKDLWQHLPPQMQQDFSDLSSFSRKNELNTMEALIKKGDFDFIPEISIIKTLIVNKKEMLSLAAASEESKSASESKIAQNRSILDDLLDVAYGKEQDKIAKPRLFTRIEYSPDAILPDNTVGKVLLEQLASPEFSERNKAFHSILEIAKNSSLEKQKEFLVSYYAIFSKSKNQSENISQWLKNFSEYLKDEEKYSVLQKEYTHKREKIYSEINDLKKRLETSKNKTTKKKTKERIKELNEALKTLNKKFKHSMRECYDESKKSAVKEGLKRIYKTMEEESSHQNPLSSEEIRQMQQLLKSLCISPSGCIGNLFSAPLVDLESKEPSIVELRQAFERNTKISDCLFVSSKAGGANDPGQFGGNYLRAYRTPDGQIRTQIIFFKQATDHGLPNQRENIAEVMAGHIMNGIVGDHAAGIILAMPEALRQSGAALNADQVYIGSLFFREFRDAHQEAHAKAGVEAGKRAKGRFAGQDINNKVLGNPHFQAGFRKLVQDEKLDVSSLAKVLFSSLLVGNYQIHTENEGTALVKGKKDFVGFDLGGAFRRTFKKKGLFKSKEIKGQFPKSVDPYRTVGRKYDTNYLLAFPVEIRESVSFISGIDAIANSDKNELQKHIENAVQYAIDHYGAKTFIKDFAKNLDTESEELDLRVGSDEEKIAKTKEFLYYRLCARQLSLQAFSLELKLKNPQFYIKALIKENPIYFKYKNFPENEKSKKILSDIFKIKSILEAIDKLEEKYIVPANLKKLHGFINYAVEKYDLNEKEDQAILIQAMNEAYRIIVAENILRRLPPNSIETSEILKKMRSFELAPEQEEKLPQTQTALEHKNTRNEMKHAEQKTALGIENIYRLVQSLIQNKNVQYDGQGVTTVHFFKDQLPEEIRNQFPNQLQHGLTVHIYKEGYVQHPPMHFMLQERMNSLCAAAKQEFGIEFSHAILPQRIQEIISESNYYPKVLSKLFKKEMNDQISGVLNQLFQKYCAQHTETENTPENFAKFAQKITKASANIRSKSAILSFDEGSKHFSFDEGASVTSHDRGLKKDCANLSWVCDGIYRDEFQITSSVVKHASLPPIDAMHKGQADKMDCLATTYRHLMEVIKKMALIRQHGRSPEEAQKPMTIDFNYALLTSNAGLDQGQYNAYLQIKRAIQTMDGTVLHLNLGGAGPTEVRVKASLMNAGINVMQNFEHSLRKGRTVQERENRKAYLHLTDAVRDLPLNVFFDAQNNFNATIAQLRFNANDSLLEEAGIKNTAEYAQASKALSKLNDQFRHQLNLYRRAEDDSELETIKAEMDHLLRQIKIANHEFDQKWNKPIEQMQKRAWERNKPKVQQALAYFASAEGKACIQKLDSASLQHLTAYILKAHMDELYYSGKYLQPKEAALFNAYLLTVQRLTGMMGSTGCKSASDRTALMRVMLAVLGHNLSDSVLPPDFDHMIQCMKTVWDSNSAMLSCISDTGAPPKFYTKNPLEGTNNFSAFSGLDHDLSAEYGMQFASHKLSKKEKLIKLHQAPMLVVAPQEKTAPKNKIGFFSRTESKRQSSIEKWCDYIEHQSPKNFHQYNLQEKATLIERLELERDMAKSFMSSAASQTEKESLGKILGILEERLTIISSPQK